MSIIIDCNGPEGNVFSIMSLVKKYCKLTEIDFKPIQEKMMSGDYDNALNVAKEVMAIEFINRP